MQKQMTYAQRKAIEARYKSVIRSMCLAADEQSGIYMFYRINENGVRENYIGKATTLIDRLCSHLMGYKQHIDLSIKAHGLADYNHPYGYHIMILCKCKASELDEKERYYILKALNDGWSMKNVESGGTLGKTNINEKKPARGYKDGLKQGYENARREVAHLFDLHLNAVTKQNKPSKNAVKALEKFDNFLKAKKEK